MAKEINTIGVLTSGGDAPGMNAAIRAVVRQALSRLAESAERLRSGISIFSNQYCRETVIQTRIDEEHLAIFQAYKDGDIEKAVQMMKTHLNDSLNYALRFLPKTF